MNLPRHSITSHALKPAFVNAHFAIVPSDTKTQARGVGDVASTGQASRCLISCATEDGFFVARTDPAELIVRRQYSALQGGLSHALVIDDSSLVVLVGGGRVPRYAPNKVVLWDQQAPRSPSKPSNFDAMSKAPSVLHEEGASELYSVQERHMRESLSENDLAISSISKTSRPEEIALPESVLGASSLETAGMTMAPDEKSSLSGSHATHEARIPEIQSSVLGQSILGSLSSSTAGLADPFEASDTDMKASTEEISEATISDELHLQSVGEDVKPPHPEPERAEATLTTGREVAELEFGELVRAVSVRNLTSVNNGTVLKSIVLVIQLQTKVLIFEIGPGLTENGLNFSEKNVPQAWGIRQRAVLEIDVQSCRCVPSITLVEGSHVALIAMTGRQKGHVQIVNVPLSDPSSPSSSTNVTVAGASVIFAAHTNPIRCITLSRHGNLLCTASEKGTLLRLWSLELGSSSSARHAKPISARAARQMNVSLLGELRRGTDSAHILSMVFSPDDQLLAAASEKGTIHFFHLRDVSRASHGTAASQPSRAATSTASATESRSFRLSRQAEKYLPSALQAFAQSIPTSVLPEYFSSQWSLCQYKIDLKVFSGRTSNPMRHIRAPQKAASSRLVHGQFEDDDDDDDERTSTTQSQQSHRTSSVGDVFVPRNDRNLEGGWATMRGRMSDIRRGERSIPESIWLTFISADSPSMSKRSKDDVKDRKRARNTGNDAANDLKPRVASQSLSAFHLLAATNSGGLYRIAVVDSKKSELSSSNHQSSSAGRTSKADTVLNMYKTDERPGGSSSSSARSDHQHSCRLIEYVRISTSEDDWCT